MADTSWSPPTIEEIKTYCTNRKLCVNADKFFEYYNRFGFLYRGVPMDWKAQLEKWNRTEYTRSSGKIVTAAEYSQPVKAIDLEALRKAIENI